MHKILASMLFLATACGEGQRIAPPGPPAPSGDEEVVAKAPLAHLVIQHDVIRLKPGMTILFATDSARILPESEPILIEVASVMEQNARIHIRIEGHTDNTASQDHNQALSDRRAQTVREYLESKGVVAERLDHVGCGENVPMADNATEDGKTQNRRVEFVIVRHSHPRGNCELYHFGSAT